MLCNNYRSELDNYNVSKDLFEKMNKTERVGCLFKDGREILSRENPNYIISLYLMKDFFVEIWYDNPSKKIERIDVTTKEEVMANYEHEIDLTDLF